MNSCLHVQNAQHQQGQHWTPPEVNASAELEWVYNHLSCGALKLWMRGWGMNLPNTHISHSTSVLFSLQLYQENIPHDLSMRPRLQPFTQLTTGCFSPPQSFIHMLLPLSWKQSQWLHFRSDDSFSACLAFILRHIRNRICGGICLQKTHSDPLAESSLSSVLDLFPPLSKTQ